MTVMCSLHHLLMSLKAAIRFRITGRLITSLPCFKLDCRVAYSIDKRAMVKKHSLGGNEARLVLNCFKALLYSIIVSLTFVNSFTDSLVHTDSSEPPPFPLIAYR